VATCDHTSEWVHLVHTCSRIAIRSVTQQKSLLALLLPVHKMQFSLYYLYTSFQVARSMWLLIIHCLFLQSPAIWLIAISGITCAQARMLSMRKTFKSTAASVFFTCTNFVPGSMLCAFSGIVMSAMDSQYSMKAPSSLRSLILNSWCGCHGWHPFSTP